MSTSLNDGPEKWLIALRDTRVSNDVLDAQLARMQTDGEGFAVHKVTELEPDIELIRSRWTVEHFRRQVDAAKRNFSLERAKHILAVRKRLREVGVEGFTPLQSLSPNKASDTSAVAGGVENFTPTPNLTKAVTAGNVGLIRSALALEIADMRLPESYLQGAMAWVATEVEGVFVPYEEGRFKGAMNELSKDESLMDQSKASWTVEYHDVQVEFLDANFSIERFLHVIMVREHLRTSGVKGFTAPSEMPEPPAGPRPVSVLQRQDGLYPSNGGSESRQRKHAEENPSGGSSGSWTARAVIILTAALAALAAYFIGRQR